MIKEQNFNLQNAERMAEAISEIPEGKFDLYSTVMEAVLLGASMARQAANLHPQRPDAQSKDANQCTLFPDN